MRLPATKALALGQDALVLPSHAERLLSCTGRHCHYRPKAVSGPPCPVLTTRHRSSLEPEGFAILGNQHPLLNFMVLHKLTQGLAGE